MKLVNMIKVIKQIHPEDLVLLKVGSFYHAYGKDAYIIAYLFNYQMKKVDNNYDTCGFPKSTINKVKAILEEKQINYLLISRSENYEVEEEEKGKDNKYAYYYSIAHKYISKKTRINDIYQYLLENISKDNMKEKIVKIEELLYEVWKV